VDVTIEVTPPGARPCADLPWTMPDPAQPIWRAPTERGSYLRLGYSGGGQSAEFVIDEDGSRVCVTLSEDVDFDEAAELTLGPVFTCVFGQRGRTCLHASVVAIDGRVLAIAGAKGAGKSTTALALVQRGGRLVSDDVAVLTEVGGRPAVPVGEPRLRMRPDPADALLGSFDELRRVWRDDFARPDKRYADLPADAAADASAPWPIDAIYLLAPRGAAGSAPTVRAVPPIDALQRLMAERHVAHALEREAHGRDFEVIGSLVDRLPVRELARPEGLHATDATIDALLADLRRADAG
jgi:hypothetical protein